MPLLLVSSHILICVFLIAIVLLQQGKGADIGATFGGGSNTLFGASGADNLLSRVTTVTAVLFMCTSIALAIQSKNAVTGGPSKLFQGNPNAVMPEGLLNEEESDEGAVEVDGPEAPIEAGGPVESPSANEAAEATALPSEPPAAQSSEAEAPTVSYPENTSSPEEAAQTP